MMLEGEIAKKKRRRGQILLYVQTNHEDQISRMDDIELWGMLQGLSFGIGQNQVLTLLQDLCERQYLRFREQKNRLTGRTEISEIVLTSAGRDVCERIVVDPAVLIP